MRAVARAYLGDSETPEFLAAWVREAERAEAAAGPGVRLRFCETNGGSYWAATTDAIAGGLLFESGGCGDGWVSQMTWNGLSRPGKTLTRASVSITSTPSLKR